MDHARALRGPHHLPGLMGVTGEGFFAHHMAALRQRGHHHPVVCGRRRGHRNRLGAGLLEGLPEIGKGPGNIAFSRPAAGPLRVVAHQGDHLEAVFTQGRQVHPDAVTAADNNHGGAAGITAAHFQTPLSIHAHPDHRDRCAY